MAFGKMDLLGIRTLCKERADMVNSQFLTDSEWNAYINQSYYELYDLLVQKYGDDYYVAPPVQFTADGSTNQFTFPDGTLYSAAVPFYKFRGLDMALYSPQTPANNNWVTVNPFNFGNRNRYTQVAYLGAQVNYKLLGNAILLTPTPSAGLVFQLWYVPRMTELVTDTDLCDGVSGWTEYIIVDAAMKALLKEESDVTVLMMAKQALIKRIEAAAENRDAGNPATVQDNAMRNQPWGMPLGGLPYGGFY